MSLDLFGETIHLNTLQNEIFDASLKHLKNSSNWIPIPNIIKKDDSNIVKLDYEYITNKLNPVSLERFGCPINTKKRNGFYFLANIDRLAYFRWLYGGSSFSENNSVGQRITKVSRSLAGIKDPRSQYKFGYYSCARIYHSMFDGDLSGLYTCFYFIDPTMENHLRIEQELKPRSAEIVVRNIENLLIESFKKDYNNVIIANTKKTITNKRKMLRTPVLHTLPI